MAPPRARRVVQKRVVQKLDNRFHIITSNIPWQAWGDYPGDHLGSTPILYRLVHHSHVIVVDGPSYRDRAHRLEVEEHHATKRKGRAKT